jgi:predicted Fe-Mo cluster-binding NifX family protein
MNIAIVSKGNTDTSVMDDHFGRCLFFAIYSSDNNEWTFVKNPGHEAPNGAGSKAAEVLGDHNVKAVISPEFGPKAKYMLETLKIEMIIEDKAGTNINEVVASHISA